MTWVCVHEQVIPWKLIIHLGCLAHIISFWWPCFFFLSYAHGKLRVVVWILQWLCLSEFIAWLDGKFSPGGSQTAAKWNGREKAALGREIWGASTQKGQMPAVCARIGYLTLPMSFIKAVLGEEETCITQFTKHHWHAQRQWITDVELGWVTCMDRDLFIENVPW